MQYVKKILLDDEKILHLGKVSWILYLPGAVVCGLALWVGYSLRGMERSWRWLYHLSDFLRRVSPAEDAAQFISYGLFGLGTILVCRAYTVCAFTELAVTDRRVIVKMGITKIITTEIDRRKIAGVVILQSWWGQIFNYGKVTLRGYSGHISGLPPIARPYELQKAVNEPVARF